MAVPKRKQSKMKGRLRRTHYTALAPAVVKCVHCGEPKRPHHVCHHCGMYRGRRFLKAGE
jgi:large subunit ribosomal protein L32